MSDLTTILSPFGDSADVPPGATNNATRLLTQAENEMQGLVDLLLPVTPGAKSLDEAVRTVLSRVASLEAQLAALTDERDDLKAQRDAMRANVPLDEQLLAHMAVTGIAKSHDAHKAQKRAEAERDEARTALAALKRHVPMACRDCGAADDAGLNSFHDAPTGQGDSDVQCIACGSLDTASAVVLVAELRAALATEKARADAAERQVDHYQTDRNALELRLREVEAERNGACVEGREALSAMMKVVKERDLAIEEKALADREFRAIDKQLAAARAQVEAMREAAAHTVEDCLRTGLLTPGNVKIVAAQIRSLPIPVPPLVAPAEPAPRSPLDPPENVGAEDAVNPRPPRGTLLDASGAPVTPAPDALALVARLEQRLSDAGGREGS